MTSHAPHFYLSFLTSQRSKAASPPFFFSLGLKGLEELSWGTVPREQRGECAALRPRRDLGILQPGAPRDRLTRDSAGGGHSPLEEGRPGSDCREEGGDRRWGQLGEGRALGKRLGFGFRFRKSVPGLEKLAC